MHLFLLSTSLRRAATHSLVHDALSRMEEPTPGKLLSGNSWLLGFLPCHYFWAQSPVHIRESPAGWPCFPGTDLPPSKCRGFLPTGGATGPSDCSPGAGASDANAKEWEERGECSRETGKCLKDGRGHLIPRREGPQWALMQSVEDAPLVSSVSEWVGFCVANYTQHRIQNAGQGASVGEWRLSLRVFGVCGAWGHPGSRGQ